MKCYLKLLTAICLAGCGLTAATLADDEIIQGAEFQYVKMQNAEAWAAQDREINAKLAALHKKYGRAPNIVHIMWDDTSVGDVGVPVINKIRGFETPNINKMAAEGILFTRMYTENSCTPSRAAVLTGRNAFRSGMTQVSFPVEGKGLPGKEVTIAEVLSKANYATGFFGKWHLGDVEESYAHNQGFDEAFFTPYNQILSLYNPKGEIANGVIGLFKPVLQHDPYSLDKTATPFGWIMTMEGKKGEAGKEWGTIANEDYDKIEFEAQKRTLDFITRSAKADKPFYAAYWPNLVNFIPTPEKKRTLNRGKFAEGFTKNVDPFIGELMAKLTELGIAENTLIIAMADNGPMVHNPPAGLGMAETIFRGGKDDFWEGGIRVPAFAWWPGVISEGQIVGDMIHQTDLFTTFARLAGADAGIPRDRVIDGIDQTALLLEGDTQGRRDYNHVYQGASLAATIKGHYKKVWLNDHGSISSPMYDLLLDPREQFPMLVPMMHHNATFERMKARHHDQIERHPNRPIAEGVPFTGISNLRPESLKMQQVFKQMKSGGSE